ncbi:LPS export ABC transporter periplasmic protein LptC [Thiorhodovibrio frisius]|uniref:Lipopolysaccharide export system protein LptC n=1 Tax=Thiorhodovibrio frisius TaxID=631362 RepID=H8YZT9_9GAMM|nr:LPS export ABC transporter periplasmic protein LptC [Thiorhodovibrio frisius]EIC22216.1 hypothetical protein Thi970DRAFT_02468 [Thiorhodovibrio frisius]WPL24510.1 Lipopolysaccharide-assembly, LptC-related [Thiorhodovibrio frisius]
MFAQPRQLLLAAVFVLLGLLGLWFAQPSQQPASPAGLQDGRRPDYVVDGVRALELDIHGQPARRLRAEQLRHYPDDDSNELDQPRLRLYDDQAPPWHIRSERGWISAGNERIVLSGEVRARRAAASDQEAIAFATSWIEVFPDDERAETDRFIELDRGADRMTAIDGMRFWYSEPMRGEFVGRVRSRLVTSETPAPPPADQRHD